MSIRILPWPWGKKCPVVIRDDDASFFASRKMLESIYSYAWTKGYKIDLAIVPFLSGNAPARSSMKRNPKLAHLTYEPCIPRHLRGTPRNYDVNDNQELVKFLSALRSEGKISLILHGYSHNLHDFNTRDHSNIEARLNSALAKFTSAFGFRPTLFVFPYYECSKEAFSAASKTPFHFFFDRPISSAQRALSKIGLSKTFKKNGENSILLIPPRRIRAYTPMHSRCSPDEAFQKAEEDFINSLSNSETFWIINHFWEFFFDWEEEISQKEFLVTFHRILDFTDRPEVWKCSSPDLVDWTLSLTRLKVERRSRSEFILKSNRSIDGLSIRIKGKLNVSEELRDSVQPLGEETFVFPHLPANQKIRIQCS